MKKIIIIGLPRTGTTSVSIFLLEAGLNVAHMGFTQDCFYAADAISDAPCFSDYQSLHKIFADARFVYLNRNIETWLPSITMLLAKMQPHLAPEGKFHPIMKRAFTKVFGDLNNIDISDQCYLKNCYQKHQQQVLNYFKDHNNFISIDIEAPHGAQKLSHFLGLDFISDGFSVYNQGLRVAAWDEYKHPNKINSNLAGVNRRKFFSY
ncbi:sulfotransferase [Paraferrimonas sp. SM1919]|uniref:sulfotransferase n=1 Tax=Paraferrimonas sp. SM1919 TaxID=2662263 RepID=UPI0013CFE3A5|nr:sulfotransferase [Paraferrimonas sp. SM1919]